MTPAEAPPGAGLVVLPRSPSRERGPLTPLITSAGWASAMTARFGFSPLYTLDGPLTIEAALRHPVREATQAPAGTGDARAAVRSGVTTAVKDLRRLVEARRFRAPVLAAARSGPAPALVWQRHELFHDAGLRAAAALGRPVVLSMHASLVREATDWGTLRPGFAGLAERRGERPIVQRADVVACVSEEVAADAARLGADPRRIVVTPNAVDAERFRPGLDGTVTRARYGLEGRFVVGWSGSFRRFHGLDALVDAVAALEHRDDVTLLLVGDGAQRSVIEARAAALGVRCTVTGAVPHTEVPALLAAMDVGVVTDAPVGDFHYSPVKLREYLAIGLPTIAPAVGDVARWVTDGSQALLFDRLHPDELTRALQRLRDQPALRHALATSGRDLVERTGSWSSRLDLVLAALDAAGPQPAR